MTTPKPMLEDTDGSREAETAIPDPFSPESLRLPQDFDESVVTNHLVTVPLGKPKRQTWFRVSPDPNYRLERVGLIALKEENEFYLISGAMALELDREYEPYTLYTVVSRQGAVSLWPIRLPGSDGKGNVWWDSAHTAAAMAMKEWTRIFADKQLGAYRVLTTDKIVAEPAWPKHTMRELLEVAFRGGRHITESNHDLIKRLRGEW